MNDPNLNVIVQDGRWGLEKSPHRYQVISVDAYRPPYIPWHMTTREFFQIARDHLTADGVLVLNVGRGPTDRRLVEAFSATLGDVFATVHVMDLPDTFNTIIYATVQSSAPTDLESNLAYLTGEEGTHPLLLDAVQAARDNLQPTPRGGTIFTDDLAPIEWITNSMVLNFFLSGEAENLQ